MYVSFMLLWGAVAPYDYLRGPCPADTAHEHGRRRLAGANGASYVLEQIPWNPFSSCIYIGIIISSCSQALQCLVVAPKLLQSISADNVIPQFRWIAQLSARNEPKRALIVTYVIGACLVLIGSLDFVAPLLSMCFLVAYIYINFSCLLLTYLKSPTWRPRGMGRKRYRVGYIVSSLAGIAVCLGVMFVVNYVAAIVAIIFGLILHLFIDWCLEKQEWGSGVHGVKFHLALSALLSLEHHQTFQINWRPQVLILYQVNLTNELKGIKQHGILKFYSQLSKSRGMCIAACVLEGSKREPHDLHKARSEKTIIHNIMKQEKIRGFSEVVVAPSWADGANYIIQLSGLGGLTPNTVLIRWPKKKWRKPEVDEHGVEAEQFVGIMSAALAEGKAVLAVKGLCTFPEKEEVQGGTIDVWWLIHDGGLLILLSWLLRQHRMWRSSQLRIFTIMQDVTEFEAQVAALKLTETLRRRKFFNVKVEVILSDDTMIELYTQDWTLKVEQRKQLMQKLHPRLQEEKKLPVNIDDLFVDEPDAKDATLISTRLSEPQSDVRIRDERHGEKKYSRHTPHNFYRDSRRKSDGFAEFVSKFAPMAYSSQPDDIAYSVAKTTKSVAPLTPKSIPIPPSSLKGTPRNANERDRGTLADMFLDLDEEPETKETPATVTPEGATRETLEVMETVETVDTAVREEPEGRGTVTFEEDAVFDDAQDVPGSKRLTKYSSPEGAEKLNSIVYEKSREAKLVIMNLPDLPSSTHEECRQYMAYCDTLVKDVRRVLFVHSAGHEVFDMT